jgi:hypothetical protein
MSNGVIGYVEFAALKQVVKIDSRRCHSATVGVLAVNPACGFYERLGARYSHSEEVTIASVILEERFYTWPDLRVLRSACDEQVTRRTASNRKTKCKFGRRGAETQRKDEDLD